MLTNLRLDKSSRLLNWQNICFKCDYVIIEKVHGHSLYRAARKLRSISQNINAEESIPSPNISKVICQMITC